MISPRVTSFTTKQREAKFFAIWKLILNPWQLQASYIESPSAYNVFLSFFSFFLRSLLPFILSFFFLFFSLSFSLFLSFFSFFLSFFLSFVILYRLHSNGLSVKMHPWLRRRNCQLKSKTKKTFGSTGRYYLHWNMHTSPCMHTSPRGLNYSQSKLHYDFQKKHKKEEEN